MFLTTSERAQLLICNPAILVTSLCSRVMQPQALSVTRWVQRQSRPARRGLQGGVMPLNTMPANTVKGDC
jgi:hypothetical protein